MSVMFSSPPPAAAEPGASEALIAFLDLASAIDAVRSAKACGFEMLRMQAGEHLLDIGCGPGTDALALAKQAALLGGRVTGVDLNPAMIAAANRRAAGLHLPLVFLQADIHALPFGEAHFDAVRIDRVLHFLSDPRKALMEAMRVTVPGGRIVVTEPDWSTLEVSGGLSDLTATVLRAGISRDGAACIGARLDRLIMECGLQLMAHRQTQLSLGDFRNAVVLFGLEGLARAAVQAGALGPRDAARWLRSLQQAGERDELNVTLKGAIASGLRLAG